MQKRGPDFSRLNWPTIYYMALLHSFGAWGIVRLCQGVVHPWSIVISLVSYVLGGFGVTAGNHRLIAHRAFQCGKAMRAILIALPLLAVQLSALVWGTRHRWHHDDPDGEKDPYGAGEGPLRAHLASFAYYRDDFSNVPDLLRDPLVMWQHRWYWPLAIGSAFVLPPLLGTFYGDAMGAFLMACARLAVQYHAAWSVNSLAHSSGSRELVIPGQLETTATDITNPLMKACVGLPTLGEGLAHRKHHKWPKMALLTSRLDLTGWILRVLQSLKLVSGLQSPR